MKNFIQPGKSIEVTAPYTVTSGGGMLVGSLFGLVADDVTSGATAELVIEGIFDLAKDTSVFSQGDAVFWDNTNKLATSTASGNKIVGRATQAQLTGDATVRLLLAQSHIGGSFQSAEQTGTGSAQNVAHGLGFVPRIALAIPTDTSPATAGVFTVTYGTHTSTNVVVTVTSGKKYMVLAIA